jgi:hypothetical protein
MIADPAAQVVYDNQGVAALVVRWLGTIADVDLATALEKFLQQAAGGGIRVILETLTALDSDTFFTAIAAFASGSLTVGNTSIAVGSTAGFPTSGTLTIDAGLAVAETVTYASILGTSFVGVSPLAHNHVSGSAIVLATGPGKGLGDSSNAATGGKIASAQAIY